MTPGGYIIRVALPTPVRTLFDYLPPPGNHRQLLPGTRAEVPFGNRTLNGLIVEVTTNAQTHDRKLKAAYKILDDEPIICPRLIRLCRWCADYYHYPIGEVFGTALPTLVRTGKSNRLRHEIHYRLTDAFTAKELQQLKRAPKQMEIVNAIEQHNQDWNSQGVGENALRALNLTGAPLKALIGKGLISAHEIAEPVRRTDTKVLAEAPLALNREQQEACNTVIKSEGYKSFLLQGVTGSGKTEVYLQIIEHHIKQGNSALVLVPEIGLTPQIVARFKHRFNLPIAVLHSGLTDPERQRAWLSALKGQTGLVIGTRSAVFVPMQKLGVIIVDEEHDLSFKQQDGMRYNARDIAVVRASMLNIPVLLGSATPSLESLHNCDIHKFHLLRLTERAGGATAPDLQLIDIRSRPLRDGLSQPLVELIKSELDAGNQVLLFLNRRGFAPTLMCHTCGWVANCPRCDARLTLHLKPHQMHCHHCDKRIAVPQQCADCGGVELTALGLGTERSEESIKQIFPNIEVIRVDRDSTRRKNAMQQLVKKVHSGKPCILIGTQMLAKGHHFPKVTLVAILDADSGLFSSDFRGLERMGQLVLQVAGRAGRGTQPGRVFIQTHHADHPILACLTQQDYQAFSRRILEERQAAGFPPYRHMIVLRAEAIQEELPLTFLGQCRNLAQKIKNSGPESEIELFGPIPAVMHRRKGRYRALLILQASKRGPLQNLIAELCPQIEQLKDARKVRWSIDVDPQECF